VEFRKDSTAFKKEKEKPVYESFLVLPLILLLE
jgi:hypothetical protein